MTDVLKELYEASSVVDLVYAIITILSLIKCYKKGFEISIKDGNKVKTEIIAKSIAIPVNTPK